MRTSSRDGASYLLDIGTGRHRVVDAIDGKDNVRQGVDGATVEDILLEREGDREKASWTSRCLCVWTAQSD